MLASIEIIRERGTRQQTRHLVEELERRGHQIGGSNKVTNLSGALSRSPILSSNRLEGWGLKEWDAQSQPEPLEGAADDDLGPFVPTAEVPLSIGEDDIPF